MNLFENTNHDILGGCDESGIKIDAQKLKVKRQTNSTKNIHTCKVYRAVIIDLNNYVLCHYQALTF